MTPELSAELSEAIEFFHECEAEFNALPPDSPLLRIHGEMLQFARRDVNALCDYLKDICMGLV